MEWDTGTGAKVPGKPGSGGADRAGGAGFPSPTPPSVIRAPTAAHPTPPGLPRIRSDGLRDVYPPTGVAR